jgi:hypothetical protein
VSLHERDCLEYGSRGRGALLRLAVSIRWSSDAEEKVPTGGELTLFVWALVEAAQCARRSSSPDHAYYQQAAERLGGGCACLAVARKLLERYHTLRELVRRPCSQHDPPDARAARTHTDAPRPAPGMLLPQPSGGRPS